MLSSIKSFLWSSSAPDYKLVDFVAMAAIFLPAESLVEIWAGEHWWTGFIALLPLLLVANKWPTQFMASRWFKPIDAIAIFIVGFGLNYVVKFFGFWINHY